MYTITITTGDFTKDYVLNYWKDNAIINSELVAAADLTRFLAERIDIDKVLLAGNKEFNYGLKEEIERLIATEYVDNTMKIEVI